MTGSASIKVLICRAFTVPVAIMHSVLLLGLVFLTVTEQSSLTHVKRLCPCSGFVSNSCNCYGNFVPQCTCMRPSVPQSHYATRASPSRCALCLADIHVLNRV
ncbi:hypothetical protein RB195_020807 [Necator americanus]|uniref:Uncharacterized protein n=1 Tax=Necator americanus TaxID=51031 RepID=A0ABR1CKL7_NECAM